MNMNKEDAIANLKMIRVAFTDPVTAEQAELIDDTFDMAIKALTAYPPVKKYRVYATSETEVSIDSEDELEIFNEAYDSLIANMDYKIVREVE